MILLNLILILINEILHTRTAPQKALQNEILLDLKLYINSNDVNVLENIFLVYSSISLCQEGKRKCVEEGTIIGNFINKINKF